MKRFQLVELEDLPWFPRHLRDYITDFLRFVVGQMDFYAAIPSLVLRGLGKGPSSQIVDLASGGGGGWPSLIARVRELRPDASVILTDRYPNLRAFEQLTAQAIPGLACCRDAVSATAVPADMKGMRTLFLSFHHFSPELAQGILQDAVTRGEAILIVEIQTRSLGDFMKHLLSPLLVLIVTPFIRPFRLGRLFYTYVVPLLPLVLWWDGVVSVLRSYRVDELEAMVGRLEGGEHYAWEMDRDDSGRAPVHYLLGVPQGRDGAA